MRPNPCPAILALSFWASGALADDAAEIRARLEAWKDGFNRRDKAAACDLFSRSLVSDVRGQGQADYETRCATIARALDDPRRSFRYDLAIKEIVVEGRIAIVRLDWSLRTSPGGPAETETGLDVFRKEEDGRWRIIRFMAYEPGGTGFTGAR